MKCNISKSRNKDEASTKIDGQKYQCLIIDVIQEPLFKNNREINEDMY